MQLNVFQCEALYRVLGSRVGLVQLPTGCGKTRLAAAAIKRFRDSNRIREGDIVFVLTPRLVIQDQVMREMNSFLKESFLIEVVRSTEGLQRHLALAQATRANSRLLIITPQLLVSSVRQGIQLGSLVRGLVLDEAHHTYTGDKTSEVIRQLVDKIVDGGGFVLGLTATPTKEALDLLRNKYLYRALSADAMVAGVLVGRLTICYAKTEFARHDIDPWKYIVPQRAEAYSRKIYEVLDGRVSSKVLVVAPNVKEADEMKNILIKMLERGGEEDPENLVRTAHYEEEKAKDHVNWFRDADHGILITVNMADIGFDVPDLEILILARKFSSPVAYTQVRGRVLRKPPNTNAGVRKANKGAILVDLVGSSIKLEREVPRVESGELLEGYEVFNKELRGYQPMGVIDIPTKVGKFSELVLEQSILKEMEEYVSALVKEPTFDKLVNCVEFRGVKKPLLEASFIYKLLNFYGIVEIINGKLRVSPVNAIRWLVRRQGVEVTEGWFSIKRSKVESLVGPSELKAILAKYKRFFRDPGDGMIRFWLADWEKKLDFMELDRRFREIEGSFETTMRHFEREVRELSKSVDVAVPSKLLLDDGRRIRLMKRMEAISQKILKNTMGLTISLLVYGLPKETRIEQKTRIVQRVSEALSQMLGVRVKVNTMIDKPQKEWRPNTASMEYEYNRLLNECKEKASKHVGYAKRYRKLAKKIRKKLDVIKNLNTLKLEILVRVGRAEYFPNGPLNTS